jgi:hypothetical protein
MSSVSLKLSAKEYPLTVVDGTELQLTLTGPTGPTGLGSTPLTLEAPPVDAATMQFVASGTTTPDVSGTYNKLGATDSYTNGNYIIKRVNYGMGPFPPDGPTQWAIVTATFSGLSISTIIHFVQSSSTLMGIEDVVWTAVSPATGSPIFSAISIPTTTPSALGQLAIVAEADVYVATRVSPAKWVKINN